MDYIYLLSLSLRDCETTYFNFRLIALETQFQVEFISMWERDLSVLPKETNTMNIVSVTVIYFIRLYEYMQLARDCATSSLIVWYLAEQYVGRRMIIYGEGTPFPKISGYVGADMCDVLGSGD